MSNWRRNLTYFTCRTTSIWEATDVVRYISYSQLAFLVSTFLQKSHFTTSALLYTVYIINKDIDLERKVSTEAELHCVMVQKSNRGLNKLLVMSVNRIKCARKKHFNIKYRRKPTSVLQSYWVVSKITCYVSQIRAGCMHSVQQITVLCVFVVCSGKLSLLPSLDSNIAYLIWPIGWSIC